MSIQMPYSRDAEQQVIGGVILDNPSFKLVEDSLAPEDFYLEAHQLVWSVIQGLAAQGRAIDYIGISEVLESSGRLAKAGGHTGIAAFTDGIPTSAMIEHHAEIVRDKATARRVIHMAGQLARDMALTTEGMSETLDTAQRDILALGDRSNRNPLEDMESLAGAHIDECRRLAAVKRDPGITTGVRKLDLLTGGFSGEMYCIIAGRPSNGKTALMLGAVRAAARARRKAGVFSLEMGRQKIMNRLVSAESGVSSEKIKIPRNLSTREWQLVMDASARISEWPVVMSFSGRLPLAELKRRARMMCKEGCEEIFIDQLSYVVGPGDSEYAQNTNISHELFGLSRELGVPVVLLAQIGRTAVNSNKPSEIREPQIHNLKTTGALEEDADMILMVHRPYVFTQDPADERDATLILGKARDGRTMKFKLEWNGPTTTFHDPDGGVRNAADE